MGLRITAGQKQTSCIFTSMADDLNSGLASGQDETRIG